MPNSGCLALNVPGNHQDHQDLWNIGVLQTLLLALQCSVGVRIVCIVVNERVSGQLWFFCHESSWESHSAAGRQHLDFRVFSHLQSSDLVVLFTASLSFSQAPLLGAASSVIVVLLCTQSMLHVPRAFYRAVHHHEINLHLSYGQLQGTPSYNKTLSECCPGEAGF